MTDNNCHTCSSLCSQCSFDLTSGKRLGEVYYCDPDGKYETGDIPDDIKIDDLDSPCKFYKPEEDTTRIVYNPEEGEIIIRPLCHKHHMELHDATMKKINEDGEYVTGIDLLDMTRETEKSIYEAFKISWTIL